MRKRNMRFYSLRTLLLMVFGISVILSIVSYALKRYYAEVAAAKQLEMLGVTVHWRFCKVAECEFGEDCDDQTVKAAVPYLRNLCFTQC